MKNTGMTRPLDHLGRIVIPKEMRISMNIDRGDPLELFIDAEKKMLGFKKFTGVSCKMCSSIEQLTYFKGNFLCHDCVRELKEGRNCQEYPSDIKTPSKKIRTYKSDILMSKLRELMVKHPAFTQSEYAKLLGISQCRVSQLKRRLEEKNKFFR
ncbi:transcriptional pleiotropic regulator of transition state genes [Paenibacillus sp. 1182]|uniref:AbrB/MazE/SpoVT family DNA-binding domain-containing protein n=1 Tax=Paenibacillus sp. 1182 TaxID=2806565 RepID=UPI001AE13AC3|nr:AbrB/MazE/SpoVT family DNA-binding domain-containing protein [Paenibacillus sp. 1182]MBP1308892.1 transcriptional pleiotropic regulator of transition state genes [Paenibacillus sp. 1182]